MLSEHIEGALGGPLTGPALEEIARVMWRAVEAGRLSWEEAGRLDGLIHERRARMRASGGWGGQGPAPGLRQAFAALKPPPRPRSPDREASLGRRLVVGLSGAIPSSVARAALARGGRLTGGHVAVLSVVGREAARGNQGCRWPIARIAALAGVSRSTVQRALRLAASLGLVRVRRRPRWGEKSETNVVTVEDRAWWRWLKRGLERAAGASDQASSSEGTSAPGGGGCQPCDPTGEQELRRRKGAVGGAQRAPEGGRETPKDRRGPWTGRGMPPEGPARGG